ncbi:MAG TPA: DUF885 family protein [Vicinamibacterales bacterium]|nr:DUF885 family protein [Vicinamibacterales bacterium]
MHVWPPPSQRAWSWRPRWPPGNCRRNRRPRRRRASCATSSSASAVDRVGHEPANAEAEVRRSFNGSYPPLYQLAYMMGGLQFRALHAELVERGRMTDRQFHDRVLMSGVMPVEMVRAILTDRRLPRDYRASWKFVDTK